MAMTDRDAQAAAGRMTTERLAKLRRDFYRTKECMEGDSQTAFRELFRHIDALAAPPVAMDAPFDRDIACLTLWLRQQGLDAHEKTVHRLEARTINAENIARHADKRAREAERRLVSAYEDAARYIENDPIIRLEDKSDRDKRHAKAIRALTTTPTPVGKDGENG